MSSFSYTDAVRGLTQSKSQSSPSTELPAPRKKAASKENNKSVNPAQSSSSNKMKVAPDTTQQKSKQEGGKKKPNKRRKNKPKLTNMSMSDLIPDFYPEKRKGGPSRQQSMQQSKLDSTPQKRSPAKELAQQHSNTNWSKKSSWATVSRTPSQQSTQEPQEPQEQQKQQQQNSSTGAGPPHFTVPQLQNKNAASWAAVSASASASKKTSSSTSTSAAVPASPAAWGPAPAPAPAPAQTQDQAPAPAPAPAPVAPSSTDFPALSMPTSSGWAIPRSRVDITSRAIHEKPSTSKKSPAPTRILKKGQTLMAIKQNNNAHAFEKESVIKKKSTTDSFNNNRSKKVTATTTLASPVRVLSTASSKLLIAAKNDTARSSQLDQRLLDNMPRPKMNDLAGDEHAFFRLMQDGKMTAKSKGRQRIKPRKKKLTALKKKVLMERLRTWRELHPEEGPSTTTITNSTVDTKTTTPNSSPVGSNGLVAESNHHSSSALNNKRNDIDASRSVCIYGFTELDDLEDDDEYDEIVTNLQELANKVGNVNGIFIPRDLSERADNNAKYPAFVRFATPDDTRAAIACWSGLMIGGQSLEVVPLILTIDGDLGNQDGVSGDVLRIVKEEERKVKEKESSVDEREEEWRNACIQKEMELTKNKDAVEQIGTTCNNMSSTIVLEQILTEDDLEDEDCLDETVLDIKTIAEDLGTVLGIESKQGQEGKDIHLVYEGDKYAVQSIVDELRKISLGGSLLSARLLLKNDECTTENATPVDHRPPRILLENILSKEDLEDEECLEECISDIRQIMEQYGIISKLDAADGGNIIVTYQEDSTEGSLLDAVSKTDGMCLGGQTIRAKYLPGGKAENMYNAIVESPVSREVFYIVLRNILTEEDMEDEECLEESLNDVRELAKQFGTVVSEIETAQEEQQEAEGDNKNNFVIKIYYASSQEAKAALEGFCGMVIGGETVAATLHIPPEKEENVNKVIPPVVNVDNNYVAETTEKGHIEPSEEKKDEQKEDDEKPKVMFSGDKRIPERFAECKRVPKVPNKGVPRSYAVLVDKKGNNDNSNHNDKKEEENDEGPSAKDLLREMLAELMRLQIKAVQANKNIKARRRIIMGLREVARGMKTHKIKMVIMANNLDEYGIIDDKLQEILDLARENAVPVLFELSKRALGKAVGKSIKVAVVGIQNTDGAHRQYVKLTSMAPKLVQ